MAKTNLIVRIDDELKANFKQLAQNHNRTMTGMVKHLIISELDKGQQTTKFKMEQDKLENVIRKFNNDVDPSADDETIKAELLADWYNADEHQEWLNDADVDDIVDWLASYYN